MRDKIDIGVIGTFGLPNGCTQSGFYNGKIKTQNKSLDLNANAIKIFPNSTLYLLRREIVNNESSLIFGKYSFAKEKNSNRGGTFIGSFISFYNYFAIPNQVYSLLDEFHTSLIENKDNILNSILQVSHSNELNVKLPKDFEKLNENLQLLKETDYFNNIISSDQNFVVYSEEGTEDKIVNFFQKGIEFFPHCETLYFTQSREIAEFVNEKRLIKIIQFNEFEKEVENIKIKKIEEEKRLEEQRREEQRRIAEEKRLEDQRREEKRKEIEERERILAPKTDGDYKHFNRDSFKKIIIDYNKLLEWYFELEKKNDFVKKPQSNSSSNLQDWTKNNLKENKQKNYTKKIFFYIIIPLVCLSLLLSNIYFIFFQKPKIEFVKEAQTIATTNYDQITELNPTPNSELSESEKKRIFQTIIKGKKIGEIVNLIYLNNPTEISKIYLFQKKDYQNNLLKLNEKDFKIEHDTVCISDSIAKIPLFKSFNN